MSLSTGLIHLWPLDEESGAPADSVGDLGSMQIYGATDAQTIIAAPTHFGNARDLEAVSPPAWFQVYNGTQDLDNFLTEWTLSCRIKRDGTIANVNFYSPNMWAQGADSGNNTFYCTFSHDPVSDANPTIGFLGYTNTGAVVFATATAAPGLTDNEWHRMTFVNTGTQIHCWVDDDLIVSSGTFANGIRLYPKNVSETHPLVFGIYEKNATDKTGFFQTDDLAIWNRALTTEEVQSTAYQTQPLSWALALPDIYLDWAAGFDPATTTRFSVLDVDDGVLAPIRIPISSWQATLQADRSSFVQAVIPAALPWVGPLNDRKTSGEIILSHGVRFMDGSTEEWEVVRAPFQQFFLDRGPQRYTGRLSSYTTLAAGTANNIHTLRNIRSTSVSTGLRVRCDLDPTVRPGHTVVADGTSFVAAYINLYANDSDRYMDVGERPL